MKKWSICVLLMLLMIGHTHPLQSQEPPTETPMGTPEVLDITFGSGPFRLTDPEIGLSDLASYRATLTITFDGTSAGSASQWSHTYTLVTMRSPAARALTVEPPDPALPPYIVWNGGAVYERLDDGSCVPTSAKSAAYLEQASEPASFLSAVIGADPAGTEKIDGIATKRYTFDENALGAAGIASAKGEVWVASDGGYVVRYRLTVTNSAGYLGDGIAGTMTWDYQLSDVNQPQSIEVPADCLPSAVLTVPLPTDAADVVQEPGYTIFTSQSSPAKIAAFYQDKLSVVGANSIPPLLFDNGNAMYGFTWDGQPVMMMAVNAGNRVMVEVMAVADDAILSAAAEVPPLVIAPEDTLGDCAAGGTPILDDASDVITLPGALSYITSMSLDNVTAYYRGQFTALGAEIGEMHSAPGTQTFEVTKGYQSITVALLQEGNRLRVSLSSPTGSPVTPTTNCFSYGTAEECAVIGIPVPPDATDVQDAGMLFTYNTPSNLADTVAFFEAQIKAQGGKVSSMMPGTDVMSVLQAQVGGASLMVNITANGSVTNVSVASMTGGALPPPRRCDSK
jgi:hypothetical protein